MSKNLREKWYLMCKDLYTHSNKNKFAKCKNLLQKDMLNYWKTNNKNKQNTIDKLLKISLPYFT